VGQSPLRARAFSIVVAFSVVCVFFVLGGYTSPPTSASTMPLVIRFQEASPRLRCVSPM
jgi:hypothetical protein